MMVKKNLFSPFSPRVTSQLGAQPRRQLPRLVPAQHYDGGHEIIGTKVLLLITQLLILMIMMLILTPWDGGTPWYSSNWW